MMILLVEMAQVDVKFPTSREGFLATQKLNRKRVSRVGDFVTGIPLRLALPLDAIKNL